MLCTVYHVLKCSEIKVVYFVEATTKQNLSPFCLKETVATVSHYNDKSPKIDLIFCACCIYKFTIK